MTGYFIKIKAPEGELEKILNELAEAQTKIYECYQRLEDLGVLTFEKGEAASGN